MKVWISKYALSDGITQHTAANSCFSPGHVHEVSGFAGWASFELGKDAHMQRADAVKAADQMRKKKIASLKKQIAKLEAMKFEE